MVSVIIPTYNRMGMLERSIESVLKQTYSDFELLIIDDGSNDGTEDYVRSLQDERICYYRNEHNMGPSASRNRGASLAKGEYLAFHDSDDEWLPDKLEKSMAVLSSSSDSVAMVYHEMYEQGEDNVIPSRKIPLVHKGGKIYDYMLLYPLIGIPAAVIKKSYFEAVGGFSEEIKSFEDYEFFLRMAKNYEIAFVQEPLILIYDTPGSVNKQYKNKIDAELYILQMHCDALCADGTLQKKIQLIRLQADNYGIEDYFYEKIFALCEDEFDEERAALILEAVHQAAMTFVPEEKGDRSAYFQNAAEQIERLVNSLTRLQTNIKNNAQMLVQNKMAIYEAMLDVLNDLNNYTDLSLCPQKERSEIMEIENRLRKGADSIPVIRETMDRVLQKGKDLLQQIGAARGFCTACGNQVRFLPMSSYQRKVREHWGYTFSDIQYLFEEELKDRCPICGAGGRVRFLLGFMEDVQSENGEKLKVGCVRPKRENNDEVESFLQRYATLRDDIEYKTDVWTENVGQNQDVLVAVDIFDGVNDVELLQVARDKIAENGICILMVTAVVATEDVQSSEDVKETITGPGEKYVKPCYTRERLGHMAEEVGFDMQVIDQNWFGPDYYEQCGFGEHAKLFILTPNKEGER